MKISKLFCILLVSAVFIGALGGFAAYSIFAQKFEDLSPSGMRERIIVERDYAIARAKANGDYRCCIDPACTMCFMEGNIWNNNTPGTCACDDLIAKGEEPCPQCARGLDAIHNDDGIFCDVDATVSTCDSLLE